MRKLIGLVFILAFFLAIGISAHAQPAAQKPSEFQLKKKTVIGGDGFWDYLTLDGNSRILYIAHGDRVEILNVDSGLKSDPIPGLSGVHGVVIAPQYGRGYISNGRGDCVTIFDLKTRQKLGEVKTGANPDAILYDDFSHRLFTFNGRSANATVIDAANNEVIGTIALGGKPEFAVSDAKGIIYANIEDTSEIVCLDSGKLQVLHRWKLAPGEEPSGLALDTKNNRLFSVCSNRILVVMNAENGAIVTTLPIGSGSDGVKFDPDTSLIFSSNGEGTLTVIHQDAPDKYSVVETVTTAHGARTLAVDVLTHRVFVATAELGPAPAATAEQPHPRPSIVPGTFMILEFGK